MNSTEILQITPEREKIAIGELKATQKSDFSLSVFDPLVVSFFNDLSRDILRNNNLNRVAATAALGFWLRRSHIESIIAENGHLVNPGKVYVSPVGLVFHICPSNVDTMFLYSLAISLLAGNKNILRISERLNDPLMDEVFDIINTNLQKDDYRVLSEYINIVTYGHSSEINSYFSGLADVRIIWGGDATINTFKSFKTGTRTRDIAFADRISCSVFKTKLFNASTPENKKEATRKFFNDSYTFDQLGCSCPQYLFLLGDENDNSLFKKDFYDLLSVMAEENYNNDISSLASLKLNKLVSDSLETVQIESAERENNYLYFVHMDSSNTELLHSAGAGYFYLQEVDKLENIAKLANKKFQTLCYFGLDKEEIISLCEVSKGLGIDRIVPVGSALDFEYIWDGYNLFDELTSKKWVV